MNPKIDDLTIRQNREPALTLTLRDALMPVFRHRRLVVLIFSGIFLGAIACLLLLPRKYEAEMKILVNRERVDAVVTPDPDNVNGPGIVPAVSEEDLNSEVELIKSRDLLERVVLACSLGDEQKSWAGQWIDAVGSFLRETPTTRQTQLARAVQDLEQRLIVDPMKKTDLIRVSYTHRIRKAPRKCCKRWQICTRRNTRRCIVRLGRFVFSIRKRRGIAMNWRTPKRK